MRALANMTSSDAIDIGTYLLGIPAVANANHDDLPVAAGPVDALPIAPPMPPFEH